jgi:hypothetical protein
MKKLLTLILAMLFLAGLVSCDKKSDSSTSIGGDVSPMSQVGTTVQSSSVAIAGVSNLNGSVVSLSGGISSYSGTGVVTNPMIKNILSNFSEITINGDNVTATGFKFKQTVEGIESFIDVGPGILVKYSSNVGDTYPVGATGRTRTVTYKSTTDDYGYGFYLIKVIQVEEPTPGLKSFGVEKVTYWANHRFGLVGVQYDFTDGSSATFPVYCSTENGK